MTLIIQKPTGAKLVLRKELPADAEADTYIAAVEAADGQALESGVKFAIKNFVLCCKDDGIWDAIKASCILAGARTLAGALVPLVGTAPTNVGGLFVSGDYNRKTGLVGDGSTKYLNSNRNNNADPQNSKHIAVYVSQIGIGSNEAYIGSIVTSTGTWIASSTTDTFYRLNAGSSVTYSSSKLTGLNAISRIGSSQVRIQRGQENLLVSSTSTAPVNQEMRIFGRGADGAFSNGRLAFYSIGESLDLALLDARVTDLINAFAAAIP
jgi:hypothetical protein